MEIVITGFEDDDPRRDYIVILEQRGNYLKIRSQWNSFELIFNSDLSELVAMCYNTLNLAIKEVTDNWEEGDPLNLKLFLTELTGGELYDMVSAMGWRMWIAKKLGEEAPMVKMLDVYIDAIRTNKKIPGFSNMEAALKYLE